jgi:hypothetical protein
LIGSPAKPTEQTVPGVDPKKLASYGDAFFAVLAQGRER